MLCNNTWAILQIGHHLFIDINCTICLRGTGFLVFKKIQAINKNSGALLILAARNLVGLIAITGKIYWGMEKIHFSLKAQCAYIVLYN